MEPVIAHLANLEFFCYTVCMFAISYDCKGLTDQNEPTRTDCEKYIGIIHELLSKELRMHGNMMAQKIQIW